LEHLNEFQDDPMVGPFVNSNHERKDYGHCYCEGPEPVVPDPDPGELFKTWLSLLTPLQEEIEIDSLKMRIELQKRSNN
jgi:hypothetical protein